MLSLSLAQAFERSLMEDDTEAGRAAAAPAQAKPGGGGQGGGGQGGGAADRGEAGEVAAAVEGCLSDMVSRAMASALTAA